MPRALGSDMKRTPKVMAKVDTAIKADSSENIAVVAREFQVSAGAMWKTVQDDLTYKSYMLKVRPLLTKVMKEKCVERSKKLLNSLKKGEV